jgi:hypothetical protein
MPAHYEPKRPPDALGEAQVLAAAGLVKSIAAQINVVIHALGILLCLPRILLPGEVVEYVSLGAGNTGKAFDLETNLRIAEFKFIQWQGGSEAIRQNALFKDFYLMAEYPSAKQKILYVVGSRHPEKFFNGRRSLSSVLSHHVKLQKQFAEKYGDQYRTVRDYYLPRRNLVTVEDISPLLPELAGAKIDLSTASCQRGRAVVDGGPLQRDLDLCQPLSQVTSAKHL